MKAEFAEKTYETLMNMELTNSRQIFAPGQHCEHHIGIDAAINSRNSRFFELLELDEIPDGETLDPNLWNLPPNRTGHINIPKFKCNIFIQYKIPRYITRSNGKEYSHWGRNYFRYRIYSEQQKILYNLEKNISSSNAIVSYSCPAIWKNNELFHFSEINQLVEKSNFVKPSSLNGHQVYTFINESSVGKGFSKPEDINSIDILKTIDDLIKKNNDLNKTNANFISSLNNTIIETLKESEEQYHAFKSISKKFEYNNEFLKNMSNILIFTILTNTNWLIGYEKIVLNID